MKIKHYICPRACGKTTFAENLQMEAPESSLLFKMEKGYWKWGFSMRGERWNRIIMDEFLFRYDQLHTIDKGKFREWMLAEVLNVIYPDGELVLISTPTKRFNQSTFTLLATEINKLNIKKIPFIDNDKLFEELDEIQHLFLCPFGTNVEIIKTDFGNKKSEQTLNTYKTSFSTEEYRTQILGEFLK